MGDHISLIKLLVLLLILRYIFLPISFCLTVHHCIEQPWYENTVNETAKWIARYQRCPILALFKCQGFKFVNGKLNLTKASKSITFLVLFPYSSHSHHFGEEERSSVEQYQFIVRVKTPYPTYGSAIKTCTQIWLIQMNHWVASPALLLTRPTTIREVVISIPSRPSYCY